MKMDYIDTSGITPQSNLPKRPYNYPCKEICETCKLCVPKNKPDIETILELHVDTSIEKSHILYTPMENKLIIYGNIHIKILYVANTSCQSVHSAHFDIPFCTFILSSNICNHIVDTTLYVEDIFVKQSDSRNFYISTLMLVYPEFNKQKNKPTNNFNNHFNNEYNMNHSNSCDSKYDKKTNTNSCINHHKYNESDTQYWKEYHDEFHDEYDIQYDTTPTTDTKIIHEKNNEYKIGSDIQFDTDYDIQFDMTPSNNTKITPQENNEFKIESDIDSDIQYNLQFDMTSSTDTKITNDKDNEYKIGSNIEFDIDSDNATDTNINLEQVNEYFEYEWE